MKLHLPKGLRAALLAVFSVSSFAYADSSAALTGASYDYMMKKSDLQTVTMLEGGTGYYHYEGVTGTSVPLLDDKGDWILDVNVNSIWCNPCYDKDVPGAASVIGTYYSPADSDWNGHYDREIEKYFMPPGSFMFYLTADGALNIVVEDGHATLAVDPNGNEINEKGITPFSFTLMWDVADDGTTASLYYMGGSYNDGTKFRGENMAILSDISIGSVWGPSMWTSANHIDAKPVSITYTHYGKSTDPSDAAWMISGQVNLEDLKGAQFLDKTTAVDAETGAYSTKGMTSSDKVCFVGDSGVIFANETTEYANETYAEADVFNGVATKSVGFGADAGVTLTVSSGALTPSVFSSDSMAGNDVVGLRVVGDGTVKLVMLTNDKLQKVSVENGTLEMSSNGNIEANLSRGTMGAAKIVHTGSGDLTVNLDAEKKVSIASLDNQVASLLKVGAVAGQGSLTAASINSNGAMEINAATTAATVGSTGNLTVNGSLSTSEATVSGDLVVAAGSSVTAGKKLAITGAAEIEGAVSASGVDVQAASVEVSGDGSLTAKSVFTTSVSAEAAGVTISASANNQRAVQAVTLLEGNVVIDSNGIKADSIVSGSSVAVDPNSTGSVTAGTMEDVTITVGSAAAVTGASSTSAVSISAEGIAASGALEADEVTIAQNSPYTIQAAELQANEILAGDTRISGNAELSGVKTLSADKIEAVKVSADTVEIADGYTVSNTEIDGGTTSIGNGVTLDNVAFTGSVEVDGDIPSLDMEMSGNRSLSDKGQQYQYTVGEELDKIKMGGSLTDSELNLSHLAVYGEELDFSSTTPATYEVLKAVTGSIVKNQDGYTEQLHIAPYVRAEVDFPESGASEKKITITGYNDEETIKEELMNSSNRTAAMEAINEAIDEIGRDEVAGTPLGVLHDNLGHIYRASQQEREQLLSAISGASTTVLADSQRRGLRDVQQNLRNRIVQMGGGTTDGLLTDWQYAGIQAWAQADASFSTTDGSGDDCGYDFNTTGATVGANLDLTANLVVGMSFSASYGEIEVDGADSASGNNDTCYLSFFARHQSNRWVQMLILTAGLNQMDLERHVGGFQAEGETEGSSLSAYYEVGYTCALDYEYNHIIQPLVSISFTSAKVDGYKESGSIGNAGLDYDSAEFFYGQVGIGARYQGVLFETVHERCAVIEARAMVTQDFGDTTDEATVGLIAGGSSYKVTGVDSTGTGFQLGVGLSIPVEQHTTVFADADITCAPDYTGVRANIGLRYDF